MSSDSDEFSFNFPNMSAAAKGSNLATYRNNNTVKAMEMSCVFGHSEGTRNLSGSRSVNNRRDSSPKTIQSVCDFQNTNPRGLPSYVTATEIALSLQYNKFNYLDLKILQKGIRCFQNRLKNYDSGEQGSNSSLSNDDDDDNRSTTRSSIFKENMSRISRKKRVHKDSSHSSTQQNHVQNANALKIDNLPNNFQSRTVNTQPLQKYRFKNRYLLPSQRFNKSIAASALTESIPTIQSTVKNGVNTELTNNNKCTVLNNTSESIHEEIFSDTTVEYNTTNKRLKLSPIKKMYDNNLKVTESAEIIDKNETGDVSFTQKLDVAENKNISFDNVNSPIRASCEIQKEKNKSRKLVSNVSCLNGDDTQDTNYLELINNIVPPNQINSTSERNKVVDHKDEDVNDRDVTSIVSECHSKDGNNTYTDEEILEHNSTDSTKEKKSKKRKQLKDCHDVLENSHAINSNSNIISTTSNEQEKEKNLEPKGNNKIKSIVISDRFWDTDMESDVENQNKLEKYAEPVIKDKVSEKCQNNDESSAVQLTKTFVVNNINHTSNTSDNVSVCSSTPNNKGKLNTRNYKIRSNKEPKINTCCTTDLKVPVVIITRLEDNSEFKDSCTTADNDKVNNKRVENKENSMKKIESIKTSSQICKSIQTGDKDNTKKCVNKASVAKGNLNKQRKPKVNDISLSINRSTNIRQTKQKTMPKKF